MASWHRELDGAAVLAGRPGDEGLTQQLLTPLWSKSRLWYVCFALSGAGALLFAFSIAYTVGGGIGLWGNNIPVAWAYAITNFVWWIGIGHAGTFISAFLLLLEQEWRASVNRIAEAMTLIAVAMAALFPVLHLGRPWFAYWLIPYPATTGVWPQFMSALPWDFAAILTYGTVSLLFWYLGLVPDLATARDHSPDRARRLIYGTLALGWRGSARHWQSYRIAYGLLAGIATPLVISVHSIVSMDFAITQLPGWHSTIFPPYFVAGALYSGFAMVLTLLLPLRRAFGLHNVITTKHLDSIGKMMLAMGWMVTYSYVVEIFIAWYSGDPFERYTYLYQRPLGPYAWVFWLMLGCNVLTPQLLWWRRARTSALALFGLAALIQVGMWTERFIIIVTSLSRDFLPSSWHLYAPTWVDWSLLLGSIGFFLFLFFLFLRYLPFIPIAELKRLAHDRSGVA
ncbi:MAG TPA: NrfD/PsrC family molybdoenzyme membrane anchor subunit [Longimicrobiales bacterium]|nr:NrfD/PsrC family molybdoenzyme membrane anchor subunit [Longimicrobiales bacterium]